MAADAEAKVSRPASEEEKKLLRSATLVREATEDEVNAWLSVSNAHMSEKARTAFMGMNAKDQFRVISEGPLTDCQDSTEILYARVKRFMEMESELRKLANADTTATTAKKKKEHKISDLARAIGAAIVAKDVKFEEVPEEERRFAAPAGTGPPPEEPKAVPPKVGNVKGVGGVIEAIQKKYGMQKGERYKVIKDTKELWKLEGDKTVPKTHCNVGWKWVMAGAEAEAKKAAKKEAPKAAPAPTPAPKEAPAGSRSRERKSEKKEKAKASRSGSREKGKRGRSKEKASDKKKGKRRRSSSSSGSRKKSSSAASSRSRGRRRNKSSSKKRRKGSEERKGRSKSRDRKKPRGRRKRSSSSSS